jgi:TPR repeat protein
MMSLSRLTVATLVSFTSLICAPNGFAQMPPQTPAEPTILRPSAVPLTAAQRSAEANAWLNADRANTIDAYIAYVTVYPNGSNSLEARRRIDAINTQNAEKNRRSDEDQLAAISLSDWNSATSEDLAKRLVNQIGLSTIERQAQAGNPRAQYVLGLTLRHGWAGANKDSSAAQRWFSLSAAKGFIPSAAEVGASLADGLDGVPRDLGRSAALLRPAAANGNVRAKFYLALVLSRQNTSGNAGYVEALALMQDASNAGLPSAMAEYGRFLVWGQWGANVEERRGLDLLRRAADGGSARAMFLLGNAYQNGKGVAVDIGTAYGHYSRAALSGDGPALTALGRMHRQGVPNLVVANDQTASRLFQSAADQGDGDGMAELGRFYSKGLGGIPKDGQKAIELFRSAAEKGSAMGQVMLAISYDNGLDVPKDEVEATRLYRLAAAQNHPQALFSLGVNYRDGLGGVARDQVEAVRLFRLGVSVGSAESIYALGAMYQNGRGGLPVDTAEATRLTLLAAEKGSSQAQFAAGSLYETGGLNLARNRREAVKWYRRAADQGWSPATAALRRLGEN